jgi:hypothetical protein
VNVGDSAEWIRSYASSIGVTFDELLRAADLWVTEGIHFSRGGQFEGEYLPGEFWTHYERVTGKLVDQSDRESFFSCAC